MVEAFRRLDGEGVCAMKLALPFGNPGTLCLTFGLMMILN